MPISVLASGDPSSDSFWIASGFEWYPPRLLTTRPSSAASSFSACQCKPQFSFVAMLSTRSTTYTWVFFITSSASHREHSTLRSLNRLNSIVGSSSSASSWSGVRLLGRGGGRGKSTESTFTPLGSTLSIRARVYFLCGPSSSLTSCDRACVSFATALMSAGTRSSSSELLPQESPKATSSGFLSCL